MKKFFSLRPGKKSSNCWHVREGYTEPNVSHHAAGLQLSALLALNLPSCECSNSFLTSKEQYIL